MPRANRFFIENQVWHITHRCHKQDFLLKFARDRRRWRHWLFKARQRYGLCVLNFVVTSNHVHLIVLDRGKGEIARSMQLVAGRTAQEYNRRKSRKGAYWEDRYHATAVETGAHLARCLVYVDLNMVRAGVVSHPREWRESGYVEMFAPPQRRGIIDFRALCDCVGIESADALMAARSRWVTDALGSDSVMRRKPEFTNSIAVGSDSFVAEIKRKLGPRARHRSVQTGPQRSMLC